jgi:hypothetical protein
VPAIEAATICWKDLVIMRAALVGTIVATCAAAAAATPAVADVKAGVDAWQQGDYVKAIAEWRPLATAGDADAQFNLGQAYKLGRGVPADMPVAMDWFRKAGAQGHQRANDNFGLLLFQQGKREEAMPFIRKSAERGEPRAQYILGTAMFNGDLVPKDWVTAYALMTRAASTGLEQATTSLSVMDRYIATDQRQKGLALAADMARAPKPTDYAAAPAPAPVGQPSSSSPVPVPVAARPAPAPIASAPPKRVASAPPPVAPPTPSAPPVATAPPPVQPPPTRSASNSAKPPPRPPAAEPPPPTHWNSADATPPPAREPAPPAKAASPPARPPARPPAPVASATPSAAVVEKPPASGSWRVQMGAFREEPRARALWKAATSRVAGLSGYKLFLEKGGPVTRMQAGPLRSKADAARLCGKLRSAGYDCLIKQN